MKRRHSPYIIIGELIICRSIIKAVLGTLPERERDVLKRYYGLCGFYKCRRATIAKRYNVSPGMTKQIVHSGLKKLRILLSPIVRGE